MRSKILLHFSCTRKLELVVRSPSALPPSSPSPGTKTPNTRRSRPGRQARGATILSRYDAMNPSSTVTLIKWSRFLISLSLSLSEQCEHVISELLKANRLILPHRSQPPSSSMPMSETAFDCGWRRSPLSRASRRSSSADTALEAKSSNDPNLPVPLFSTL